MSLIDNLSDDFLWQEFLNHKKSSLLTDKISAKNYFKGFYEMIKTVK